MINKTFEKTRKFLLITSLMISFAVSNANTTGAYTTAQQNNIVVFDNGDYIETTINFVPNTKKQHVQTAA